MRDTITSQARHLAMAVAPELADWPLYIVDVPREWLPVDCLACAIGWIDPLWLSRLQERGEWVGNGRLVAFVESALQLTHEMFMGVMVHELAHMTPGADPGRLFAATAENVILAQRWATEDAAQGVDDFAGGSADHHGADFVRRLLHLRHRAERYGLAIPWDAFGVRHGPCHVSMMARALGDEPSRLVDATFSEIEQTMPPASYSALWQPKGTN